MRVEIWQKPEPKPEPEKVLRLALRVDRWADVVRLVTVDENGNRLPDGDIAAISNTGRFRRCRSVNRNIGLDLDDLGRIVEDD